MNRVALRVDESEKVRSPMMVAPANTGTPFELFSHGLDDNFFCVVNSVNNEPELTVINTQHNDIDAVARDNRTLFCLENLT